MDSVVLAAGFVSDAGAGAEGATEVVGGSGRDDFWSLIMVAVPGSGTA